MGIYSNDEIVDKIMSAIFRIEASNKIKKAKTIQLKKEANDNARKMGIPIPYPRKSNGERKDKGMERNKYKESKYTKSVDIGILVITKSELEEQIKKEYNKTELGKYDFCNYVKRNSYSLYKSN